MPDLRAPIREAIDELANAFQVIAPLADRVKDDAGGAADEARCVHEAVRRAVAILTRLQPAR